MKRFRRILILVLCVLPLALSAQEQEYTTHTVKWYEDLNSIAKTYNVDPQDIIDLNGLKSTVLKRRQELKIPLKKAKEKLSNVGDAVKDIETDRVKATLILPFSTANGINGSNYDFYSGVLLAVRDLADQGINTDLQVFDMRTNSNPASASELSESDVIIGPLSTANISTVLEDCPWGKYVVSPLDSRAASLAESGMRVIQAPSSADMQLSEIVSWIAEERKPSDKLILFTENNATPTALASKLAASGMQYNTINYGILQGRNVINNLQSLMNPNAVNHVVIASDNEAFVNDVVRNLNLMAFRDYNVVLYGPSRIRNFETIDVENFHNTHLHLCSSYFIDYDDPAVKHFLMAYRALFNAEPGPYAFQGYDTAKYFISMFADYGSEWTRHLSDRNVRGLQSDFYFTHTGMGGYLNQAVRRVVYDKDLSIKLLK